MVKKIKMYGYTILELLVVLVIISAILVITSLMYYRTNVVLKERAKLTTVSQNLLLLLSDARGVGFSESAIVCVKYATRSFTAFVDNDINGIPDSTPITQFDFNDTDYEDMTFKFNGVEVDVIDDLYTIDGIFVKKLEGTPVMFSTEYSSSTFEFVFKNKKTTVSLIDSFPKILEQ